MNRLRISDVALALVMCLVVIAVPVEAAGELVAPPAIHLPYGSSVQTELNFSNNDVLGLIREILPAAGDLIGAGATLGGADVVKHGSRIPIPTEALAKLDFKPLADALEGLTNIRVLVAKYKPEQPSNNVLDLFNSGAAKLGDFNKIITDFSLSPGVLAVYAQSDGGGYLFYNYDPRSGSIYAARLSGRVDVGKLMKWASDTIKMFTASPTRVEDEPEESTQAPESSAPSE